MRAKYLFIIILFLLFCRQAEALKATIDPSELAVGVRSLGMGRAFVGLADDVTAVFQNPAGLALQKNWQLTSMYSNLLNEIQYNQAAGMISLGPEALGIGYVGASIGGSLLSERDPVTNRIVPIGGAMSYTNSVLIFSGATRRIKNLSLGCSLKVFGQSLAGVPGGDVHAIGQDLDVGLKYTPNSWLSLGACGYNILPYSSGGKLNWETGLDESIPSSAKTGLAIKLIGEGGLREFRTHCLYLTYDYEFFPTRGERPGLHHLGMEWLPWRNLAFRVGLDQDAIATGGGETGVYDNFAAGVGVNFRGIRLDYAFHTFGDIEENNSHFFSLSYGIEEELPPRVPPPPKAYLEITQPAKKLITFDPSVTIAGKVLDMKKVKEIKIGPMIVIPEKDASFSTVVDLPKYAINTMEVLAIGATGRILETKPVVVVFLVPFIDISEDHPLRYTVGALAALEYVRGYEDGSYRPAGDITRAEFCTLLMRIESEGEAVAPSRAAFKDVSIDHWAAGFIEKASELGFVKGYPDKTFRPRGNITRAEAISVLTRFAGFEEPLYIYENPFPDVESRHWAAKAVHVAKEQGFLDYLKGEDFEPQKNFTRGEMADMLAKVDRVARAVNELLE